MRHLEITPPPCDEHLCLRQPRGRHHCGLMVVVGAVRASRSNGNGDGIFVDDIDNNYKGKDARERRMGEPTGVSRVNTRDVPRK